MPASRRVRFDLTDQVAVLNALSEQELWPYDPAGDNYWTMARSALVRHFSSPDGPQLFAVPASSGTAAIHVALGGLQIPAGSEVIVPPITDMGTVMPVIFQNAIPVFADVDPDTCNLSAATIEKAITARTRAVIVVHLGGSPPDLDPIVALCKDKGVMLIEDAAQALGATYKGRPLGTFGDAGCFSLNSQKHITCGEGGFVLVKTEDAFDRCLLFSDKHRSRVKVRRPEFESYAGAGLNYRLSDLELALIVSQLPKLPKVATRFTAFGDRLDHRLKLLPGVAVQTRPTEAVSTYFMYIFRLVGAEAIDKKPKVLAAMTAAAEAVGKGLFAGGAYVKDPLYRTEVFKKHNFFDTIGQPDNADPVWPALLVAKHHDPALPADYGQYGGLSHPNSEAWIATGLSFNGVHDGHTIDDADTLANAIGSALLS